MVIISHLLNEGVLYDEGRYNRLSLKVEEIQKKRALETLHRLGYDVKISIAA